MSDIDPTPGTPVTLGDRLAWLRGDVTANQLALLAELAALRGTPATTLAALAAELAELRTGPSNSIAALAAELAELRGQMTLVQEALGASPYQALTLTTTRGLLNAILSRLTTLANGRAPAAGTSEYVANDETIYDGRRYALFSGSIPGVTISEGGREITRTTWEGWEYYIQTTDPAPWANGVPTVGNIWAPFAIFTTWDFSVNAQYPITVHLRDTNEIPTQPMPLWIGSVAEPEAIPGYGGFPYFFALDIPVWADRIVYDLAANGGGNLFYQSNTGAILRQYTGTSFQNLSGEVIPIGAVKIAWDAGSNWANRATGSVYALAPGVVFTPGS